MSAEAVGWVWRRSPYKGVTFLVHMAIADSVNDQNDQEFWMRQGVLAAKARTQRSTVNKALAALIEDGYLELLDESAGGANRYRFLMPHDAPIAFDSRPPRKPRKPVENAAQLAMEGVRSEHTGCAPSAQGVCAETTGGVRSAHTEPKGTQGEPKDNNPPATGSVAQQIVRAVWERANPKPATPFIAAVKIAERLLAAGWSPAEIEDAMVDAPTISTGAVELALARHRGQAKPRRGAAGPVASRRDGPEGRVQA